MSYGITSHRRHLIISSSYTLIHSDSDVKLCPGRNPGTRKMKTGTSLAALFCVLGTTEAFLGRVSFLPGIRK